MTQGDFRNTLFLPWLNRPDLIGPSGAAMPLATVIINRAIARIEREVRLPCMESAIACAPDANGFLSTIPIPADFLEAQRIEADGRPLQMITPEGFLLKVGASGASVVNNLGAYSYPNRMVGAPAQFFTRVQNNFLMTPYPQRYASLFYYAQFAPMTVDSDTNALLSMAPELAMWAALSYAGSFFRMDEMQEWEMRYQAERDAVKQQALDADNGGGPNIVQSGYDGGYL